VNTGGPAFPHGPLGDSIQHEDGRISHQWQGSAGMDLLDWMAGQALAAMVEAESKESHKQLTNDGYEHEATHFPRGFADEDYWDGAAKASYACAAAMLAEKARREADHSGDANKTVPSKSALIRAGRDLFTWADKTMDETDECRVFLHNWREAVRCQPEDNSPDAGKMAALEASNRELVEALESCEAAFSKFAPQEESAYGMAWIKVRATLAKAKGVA